MSWLSKALGLDKHPAELAAINSVGNTILKGVEASSPVADSLVKVLETVGESKISAPMAAVSAIGTIVAVLDPQIISQIEGVVNSALLHLGVSQSIVSEIDSVLEAELKAVGL